MAQQRLAGKGSRSRGNQNGHEDKLESYEQELAGYLRERIKPGLNSGAIPLLARSIAKEIAHREPPPGTFDDSDTEDESGTESEAEAEDETTGRSEDEDHAEADEDEGGAEDDGEDDASEAQAAFEADMHDLQAEFGEDWILRFSVHGDDAWLTAEKDDGSQRVEAPTADVLAEAVELLNSRGGRSD
jgi:hypothetical protein